jgi:hypothetical protein
MGCINLVKVMMAFDVKERNALLHKTSCDSSIVILIKSLYLFYVYHLTDQLYAAI